MKLCLMHANAFSIYFVMYLFISVVRVSSHICSITISKASLYVNFMVRSFLCKRRVVESVHAGEIPVCYGVEGAGKPGRNWGDANAGCDTLSRKGCVWLS